MKILSLAALTSLLALGSAHLNAQVIADNFDRTGDLSGSAPSTPQASNPSETWTASETGAFTMDSTGLLTSTGTATGDSGTAAADLDFTLTSGNIYTLAATLDTTGGQWLAFGFQEGSDVTTGAPYLGISPWLLLRADGTGSVFTGPNVAGQTNFTGTTGANNLSLVLNTTTPDWTYTAYDDGVAVASSSFGSSPSDNPSIDHLFIESYQGTTGTFSKFSLTTTPEPSTYLLMFAGLLGLVAVWRGSRSRL